MLQELLLLDWHGTPFCKCHGALMRNTHKTRRCWFCRVKERQQKSDRRKTDPAFVARHRAYNVRWNRENPELVTRQRKRANANRLARRRVDPEYDSLLYRQKRMSYLRLMRERILQQLKDLGKELT